MIQDAIALILVPGDGEEGIEQPRFRQRELPVVGMQVECPALVTRSSRGVRVEDRATFQPAR